MIHNTKISMLLKFSIIGIFVITLFSACEPEDTDVDPDVDVILIVVSG